MNGETRIVGVMGWPVKHSRSPQMQNAALEAAGINGIYVPFPVAPDRVGAAVEGIRALGLRGSNVTIPHKESVIEFLDELTPQAKTIGAVNTIIHEDDGRLVGTNTDCEGATRAVIAAGAKLEDATVAVIGAGGAGRGCAAGCAFAGAKRIIILNRTVERAERLTADLGPHFDGDLQWEAHPISAGRNPDSIDWNAVDVVFQMTSMGMNEDEPLPLDVHLLRKDCHILEAVYAPLETLLLRAARERGLPTTDGLAMLVEQGALSFEIWFGVSPDRKTMREALISAPAS